jgi:hypothetical protein
LESTGLLREVQVVDGYGGLSPNSRQALIYPWEMGKGWRSRYIPEAPLSIISSENIASFSRSLACVRWQEIDR